MMRLLAMALLLIAALAAGPPLGAAPVREETVHEIGAQLRCVVCQSLSVADSPSETANQMRGIIRERLAAGDSPERVKAYFVEKYGLWILLAPPPQGFNLLVWVVPFVALGAGLALVLLLVRRWSRRPAGASPAL
jgi:cytochrome c-type biogenesis protein CcmH